MAAEDFFEKSQIHGKAKRVIEKKALQAWLPYHLFMGYKKLIYIDGFSGKGVYKDEQSEKTAVENYGSPVIALHCILDCFRDATEKLQKQEEEKLQKQEEETDIPPKMSLEDPEECIERTKYRLDPPISVDLFCVEKDEKILSELKVQMKYREKMFEGDYDKSLFSVQCKYECNSFKNANILEDGIDDDQTPMFTFLDPFGFSHTPMYKVRNFLGRNRSLLINVMIRDMNRFKERLPGHLDEIYGHRGWRDVPKDTDPASRYEFFTNLYMDCLKENGAEFTISFPVRNDRNHLVYYLVFATGGRHSYKCFQKFKEALNRASIESKELSFSGYKVRGVDVEWKNIQDQSAMATVIFNHFVGQRLVDLRDIENFVWMETPFIYRKKPLKMLEYTGRISMVYSETEGRRKGTYPEDTTYAVDFDKFRNSLDHGVTIELTEPNNIDDDQLVRLLYSRFKGKRGVKLNRIEWWAQRMSCKLQKRSLKRLENEGKLHYVHNAKCATKRRRGTFPEGSVVNFTKDPNDPDEESSEIDESVEVEEEGDMEGSFETSEESSSPRIEARMLIRPVVSGTEFYIPQEIPIALGGIEPLGIPYDKALEENAACPM